MTEPSQNDLRQLFLNRDLAIPVPTGSMEHTVLDELIAGRSLDASVSQLTPTPVRSRYSVLDEEQSRGPETEFATQSSKSFGGKTIGLSGQYDGEISTVLEHGVNWSSRAPTRSFPSFKISPERGSHSKAHSESSASAIKPRRGTPMTHGGRKEEHVLSPVSRPTPRRPGEMTKKIMHASLPAGQSLATEIRPAKENGAEVEAFWANQQGFCMTMSAEFRAWALGQQCAGPAPAPCQQRDSPGQTSKGKKRTTERDFDETEGDGSPDERRVKRLRTRREQQTSGCLLACPFYRKSCIRHHDCRTFGGEKISHVVQHLRRTHHRSHFLLCPTCGLMLDTQPTFDTHVQAESCENRALDFMTENQLQQIRDVSTKGRKLSDEEKWYKYWGILCPGTALPTSPRGPYLTEHDLLEELASVWTFVEEAQLEPVVSAYVTAQHPGSLLDRAEMRQYVCGLVNVLRDATVSRMRQYASQFERQISTQLQAASQIQDLASWSTDPTGAGSRQAPPSTFRGPDARPAYSSRPVPLASASTSSVSRSAGDNRSWSGQTQSTIATSVYLGEENQNSGAGPGTFTHAGMSLASDGGADVDAWNDSEFNIADISSFSSIFADYREEHPADASLSNEAEAQPWPGGNGPAGHIHSSLGFQAFTDQDIQSCTWLEEAPNGTVPGQLVPCEVAPTGVSPAASETIDPMILQQGRSIASVSFSEER